MAGPSNKTDIQTNGNQLDAIEVIRTAITSILAGEGLTMPTEEAKLCLEFPTNLRIFSIIPVRKESLLLNN